MVKFIDWYKTTIPKAWLVPTHIVQIGERLDRVLAGTLDRLAIHMPPRHGKSETVTIRFALRWLELNPGKNLLVTGYNERFARKFSRKIRNLAAERGLVAADKKASDEWETTSGSLVMARGVGSPPTGTGFGLIIVDDPVRKREDAESEVYREKVWDWYTDDLYSRLEPGGALVLVMTLWHEDDLGARAVASEPFEILKLPAISEAGEALWPERYPLAALERIRSVMANNEGLRGWEALYQQNPTPREGTFFQVSKLKIVDYLPSGLNSCMGLDLAASQGEGDWTAAPIWHGPDSNGEYFVEPWRIQCEPAERNRQIRQRADLKRPRTIRWPQDPGAAGVESAQSGIRLLAGHNIKTAPVSGDKQLRAEPQAAQVNAGNVNVIARNEEERQAAAAFIEEYRQFPAGKHDDQVDGSSDAFSEVAAVGSLAVAASEPTVPQPHVGYAPR